MESLTTELVTLLMAALTTFLVALGRRLLVLVDRAPAWAKQLLAVVVAALTTVVSQKLGIAALTDLSTLDQWVVTAGTALAAMGLHSVLKQLKREA